MLLKKKNIPPGLLNILRTEKKVLKKNLLLIGTSASIVAAGFILVFVFNHYLIPKFKKVDKIIYQNSMTQIQKPQQTTYIQPQIEQPSMQTRLLEPEISKQTTQREAIKKSPKNNDIEKQKRLPQQKPLNQNISEKKMDKPTEIPLEQFNVETVRAVDYLYRAQDLEAKGNYSEAISEYKEYLKITGKQEPKILNKIATLYLLIGNFTEASHYAEKALQQAPDNLSLILNYGVINAKLGNLSKAEECFRKVLSVSPEHKTALYNLALLKEKKKEFKEALKLYEKLYQLGDSQAVDAIERVKSHIKKEK